MREIAQDTPEEPRQKNSGRLLKISFPLTAMEMTTSSGSLA
jgi:hypothetical protein